MVEEASMEFRLRKLDETRNYFLDKIKHSDLMSENYKKTGEYLNYIEHLLILVSAVAGSILISAFASLVCVPVGITSSVVEIKIGAIIARIKKCKSIIKKKKKQLDKIVLLGKDKLNTIEVVISKSLINLYISHDEFVSVNNTLREYNEMKDKTRNPETILYKNNGNLSCQL